nr:hypothetical protein [Tanacetum cinerariifolium]
MGEPLSPDRVFEFPMDEPEPHPAYDFFTPGLLPRYAVDEIAEPIVEAEEQVIALVIDMEEDIAMLFGDGDFSDDDSEGFKDEEEVWEVNEEWLMAPVTPPPMLVVPPLSTYEVGGPYTAAEEQPFTLQDRDFLEIGPRVSAIEGQVEQCQQTATQRDEVIEGLSQQVKENQEKDKIGSKPDKNGKRVEAGKSLKQLQWLKGVERDGSLTPQVERNKTDLEDQCLDDLFNNLKIYEAEVKSSSSTSPTTQNIAFVSSQNTDNTNESVSVVASVSATSTKVPVSALPNVDNLSDGVIYSFASQSNSPRLDNDDLKQIDADDLEEMNLKWQMAMLTMRVRRFLQRTGKNLGANGTTSIGFDMSKVECYNCHRRGHFLRECRSPKDTKNKDTQRRNVPVETSTSNALVSQCDGVGSYDWSFQADEEPTNYALMAFTSSSSTSSSSYDNEVALCTKACLESVKARLVVYQQNENVFEEDIKLLKHDVMLRDNALVELRKKFENAEKERDELKLTLEKFQTSSKNLSKLLASQITDKTGLSYGNQVFNSTVFNSDELFSSTSDVSLLTSPVHDRYKSSEGYHAVPPPYTGTFMPYKPDLVFYDAPTACENVPNVLTIDSSASIKDMTSVKRVEHTTPDEHLRKDIPQSRGHRHSWNRKACFVCKSLNHLIKDCDYFEKKIVQNPVKNHAMKGNHQHYARMTHSHPNRHVVPTTVLTKSRLVLLTAARPVTSDVPPTNVKHQRLAKHVVNQPHSPIRRPINNRTTPKYSPFHQKVTTVKANQVNAVQDVKGN